MTMNLVACLLGALTVTSSLPVSVYDATALTARLEQPSSFAPSCGIEFFVACRPVSGTRTSWLLTAWALDGSIERMTTQRDTDAQPVVAALASGGPQAYQQVVVQRTSLLPPQSVTVTATRSGGCQASVRVEAR